MAKKWNNKSHEERLGHMARLLEQNTICQMQRCDPVDPNDVPRPLFDYLLERIQDRSISVDQLQALYDWLETQPEVPEGEWFKRFPDVTVCGEGQFVKMFLLPGQIPHGQEVE